MKNLQKILALLLALIMSFSLVTIASAKSTKTYNAVMSIPEDVEPAACTFVDKDKNPVPAVPSVIPPDGKPYHGFKLTRFRFTVDSSVSTIKDFEELDIRRDASAPKPPVTNNLPYRAVQVNGIYEFYGYGSDNAVLTEAKLQTAIAGAEGVDPANVSINTETGEATITTANGSYTVHFSTAGPGSQQNTKSLYKVTYNGTFAAYVYSGEKDVSGFLNGGNGYVLKKNTLYTATLAGSGYKVTSGKISTINETGDADFVDAVMIREDSFAGLPGAGENAVGNWSLKDNDTWTDGPRGTCYIQAGTEVRFSLDVDDTVLDAKTEYSLKFNDTVVNTMDGDGVETTLASAIPASSASVNGRITVSIVSTPLTDTYSVYINGNLAADNIEEENTDGYIDVSSVVPEGTRLALIDGKSDKPVCAWSKTTFDSNALEVGSNGLKLNNAITRMADDDRRIWLYTVTRVELTNALSPGAEGDPIAITAPNGKEAVDIGANAITDGPPNYVYVANGATITIYASTSRRYVGVKEGDDSRVLRGDPTNDDTTRAHWSQKVGDQTLNIVGIQTHYEELITLKGLTDGAPVSGVSLEAMAGADLSDISVRIREKDNDDPPEMISHRKQYTVTIGSIREKMDSENMDYHTLQDVQKIVLDDQDSELISGRLEKDDFGDTYTLTMELYYY